MYYSTTEYKIIEDRIVINNQNNVEMLLKDKIIFITGAAGSVGRKLCETLLNYSIRKIIAFDINELSVFNMEAAFSNEIKNGLISIKLGSILDNTLLQHMFELYKPSIVIHAAAYKHVSIANNNPSEAIKCNVQGTINVLNVSMLYNVQHFVYLSSDKAVNPSSIMGATKRISEIIVNYYNSKSINNFYSIIRFGNVFGSSGSVVQIFEEQIITKQKINITHPDMNRYFMSLNDAVNLIVASILLHKDGNMFICDMKQSLKIIDLAKKMINILGYREEEIEIQYTKIREGESLFEELYYPYETVRKSSINNILVCDTNYEYDRCMEKVYDLIQHIYSDKLLQYIRNIVPEYIVGKDNKLNKIK